MEYRAYQRTVMLILLKAMFDVCGKKDTETSFSYRLSIQLMAQGLTPHPGNIRAGDHSPLGFRPPGRRENIFPYQESAEAKRLLKFFDYCVPVPDSDVPNNSLLREFIGGSIFRV